MAAPMSASGKQVVYVDTCVVIEATRTKCWNALLKHFAIRTVEEVRRETQAGNRRIHGYVKVDLSPFDAGVTVFKVSNLQIAMAQLKCQRMTVIDPGERDLLAYVAGLDERAWILTTGDRAAVWAACSLGLGDRLRSLEELAQQCGQKPLLGEWFKKKLVEQRED